MSSHTKLTKRRLWLCPIVLFLLVSIFLLIGGTPRNTVSSAAPEQNEPVLPTGFWTRAGDDALPNPGTLADHAMAYDSLRGRVVLFGGTSAGTQSNQRSFGETWEWDGTTWRRMATTGPSPRYGHALAYDSSRQRVVLFGGQTTLASGPSLYLNDTWEWDGVAWTQVVSAGPSARSNHAMVYDSARSRIVLYGGFDGSGKSDTWERNGSVWTAINPNSSPGVRHEHALAYDHQHQRSLLFGGLDANGASTNDTWEWDGTGWTQVATTGPSPRFGHAMAFDETCGKVILFGGFDQISQRDTWAWDGATWFLVTISGPQVRRDQAMAYDSINGTIVMFGGRQDLYHRRLWDTWVWRSPCDDEAAELDKNGEVVLPPNLDPDEPIIDEEVNKDNGLVSQLYPSYDTRTDAWYKDLLCNPSVGGTIPPEASNPDLTGQLEELKITGVTPAQMATSLETWEDKIADTEDKDTPKLAAATAVTLSYQPPADPHCPSAGCKYIFGGRDIVFVHGLDTDPLLAKIFGTDVRALTEWPNDRSEFYGTGYWKQKANSYWTQHIKRFMTDRGIRNRYLIVAYASTQRLEIGVQAILAQIADAMQSGEGVVDPSGHNDKSKFGTPSFVIVSHSAGALAADAAMQAAVKYPNLQAAYIPQFAKGHIALQGAFSGSRYATAAVVLGGLIQNQTPPWLCPLVNNIFGITPGSNCPPEFAAVKTSVLVDLVPLVSQLKWGSFIRESPVRTITVVGGHPSYLAPLKYILQPGFDDGVLNINSQVANPNTTLLWPSGYVLINPIDNVRVFDMGVAGKGNAQDPGLNSPARAIGYYIDQVVDPRHRPVGRIIPGLVASGVSPYISPTGMLQPFGLQFPLNSGLNPRQRYPHHYSFIQSAADHFQGSTGDGTWNGKYYRDTFSERNFEETSAITDLGIFEKYPMFYPNDDQPLLSQPPTLREEIRGRSKTFKIKIFGKKFQKTVWFWKRKYHLMEGWRDKVQMDYVQEFVLRGSGYQCPPNPADDCNGNGSADECDIANGTSVDCNHNGKPDECEPIRLPVITQGPNSSIQDVGSSASFSVVATGTGSLSYQWRKDGVNLIDDGRISGSKTSHLTINPTVPSDKGVYDCVVTGCGSATSNQGRLTIRCLLPPQLMTDIEPPTGGVPYVYNLVVTGGCGSNVFDLISGTLPPGLTLSPSGTISGTPVGGSGFFEIQIRVTDACGCQTVGNISGSVGKRSCPNPGAPYPYIAGNPDDFAPPNDPALPSAALKAAVPNAIFKSFDDATINRFVGQTFTNLPANIVRAELEVRMRPQAGQPVNDSISLAFTPRSPSTTWSITMDKLALTGWNPGNPAKTFTLDLAQLPLNGSLPSNLLATLAAKRHLDVVIQDDTTVDYMKLRVWTCQPRDWWDEFCISGSVGSLNSRITDRITDSPFSDTVSPSSRNRGGVRYASVGLCYKHVLYANNNVDFQYAFNATPVAVLSYPEVQLDFGLPVPSSERRRNVFGAGFSPIGFQLSFRPQSRIRPFVNTSGGFIYFEDPVPRLDGAQFNLTFDVGGGVQVFRDSRRAFNFGYKYQHLSNGGRARNNPGFDGHVFYFGYSIFKAPKNRAGQ